MHFVRNGRRLTALAAMALLFCAGAALPGCAASSARPLSSAPVAEGAWAKAAEKDLDYSAHSLWASVAFREDEAFKAQFYQNKQLLGAMELNQGVLDSSVRGATSAHNAFLELLGASMLFEGDAGLNKIYVDKEALEAETFRGLHLKAFANGSTIHNGQAYSVVERGRFELSSELKGFFEKLTAPVPKLPAKKERINFGGELDPAEAFRRVGLDPEKIAIVLTDEKGEEQSYDVSFFHDRYYLGGVSFAQHPKRWEDYSGIPSAHLHGRGLGTLLYILATFQLKDFSKLPLISDGNRSGQADSVWENLVAAGWAAKSNPPGSGGVATYKFNMKALEKQPLMKEFSKRREVIQARGEEG